MLINHDTQCALDVLVDLVNTAPDACGQEGLPDLAALRDFVVRHAVSEVGTLTAADLDAVRAVRARFQEVFRAPSTRVAADLVNALVARAGTTPRLTDHDGHEWHLHFFAPGAALADHLAADSGMAVAFIVAGEERDRLRFCEAPGCARVFVDLSRNRSRRYCDSRTCGNRLHVAAYRARRRTAPEQPVRV
ncbi:CGNR zinc finger domain-containing protein [Streptacidiphilus sp. EB129]|uniref:CGNR zinc finger domain-containing protein n=1 Tax=Streptacidiphilus sp. EB129 TaxID=3156262 RepID=UPI003514F3D6